MVFMWVDMERGANTVQVRGCGKDETRGKGKEGQGGWATEPARAVRGPISKPCFNWAAIASVTKSGAWPKRIGPKPFKRSM
jgi:hypothetical protein